MHSHEVIQAAAERIGVKALAAELKLSPALVYKWCQEWDPDDPDTSGARNPLDRVRDMFLATGDIALIRWLCHEAGGFFVPNPHVRKSERHADLILTTQKLVAAFSDLLEEVSRSIQNDGQVKPDEAERIRRDWESLKSVAESFVAACEGGLFASQRPSPK
jgi:hypothetical protein